MPDITEDKDVILKVTGASRLLLTALGRSTSSWPGFSWLAPSRSAFSQASA